MATTTKKSPKAKTKTTKAKTTTRSTAKKTSAAKAAPKAASKSAKAVKPTKTVKAAPAQVAAKRPAKTVSLETLRKLNIFAAVLFVVLAAVAWFVMGSDTSQLTLGHLAKDTLASTDKQTVLAPAARVVGDVEIRWLVVATLVLSAIVPVLNMSKLQARYHRFLKDSRMDPYRWVDLGVTTGLIVATTALLSGVSNLLTLKMVIDFMVISAILALIAERQNNTSVKTVWSAYLTSLFSGVVPWFLIGAAAIGSVVYGSVTSPWYVYALYAVVVGGFALLAGNQWKQYHKSGAWGNYLTVERNYIVINVLMKAAFALVLIAGLLSIDAVA